METIDIDWLKRIERVHDKFSRSIPLNSKQKECTQSIFINRYFKFLSNRCFKIKINDNIYYALFSKSIMRTKGTDYYSYNYGVRKYLGYSQSKFELNFFDERVQSKNLKLHWNEIIRIEYEEITLEKYYEIVKLFI